MEPKFLKNFEVCRLKIALYILVYELYIIIY